mgnify:CR=1 FL=1
MTLYLLFGLLVLAIVAFTFFIGKRYGLHKYSKKLLEESYAGDLVINMASINEDLISVDFTKNPKELVTYDYIVMGVKIRK